MENIKDLISENKFIRVDKEGQHIENIDEYASQNLNDVLKGLNRHPGDLISLFERTQNQKFLNDIGLAYIAEYYYGQMINLKKELKYQIDGYENELATLKEQNAELENKLNSNKDIDDEIETYKDIVKRAEEDKNVIKTQLNEYKQKLNNSELAYEELRKKYTENSQEIKNVGELKAALDKLKGLNEELNISLVESNQKVEDENKFLKEKIISLQKQYNDSLKENNESYNKINELENLIKKLETENKEIHEQYDESRRQLDEYKQKLNNSELAYEELRQKYAENSNKIKEITELETALAKVKESNQNLNTSYEKVTNECNDLKDNISVLQRKYNDTLEELEKSSKNTEELEKKYKEELDKSRQKIETLQMNYNKLEDTYKVDIQKTKEIEDKYNNGMMVINSIKRVLLDVDRNNKVVGPEVKANKSQDNNEMIPDNNEVTSIAKTFGLHNMPSLI